MAVRVNGRRWPAAAAANGYVAITREWKDGDLVDVDLPLTLAVESLPGSSDVVAFVYGPIVLAGRLGKEGLAAGNQIIVNERESGSMLNANVDVPTLAGDSTSVLRRVRRDAHDPLTFRTSGIGRPNDVELTPYYRLAHERYNLYWTLTSD